MEGAVSSLVGEFLNSVEGGNLRFSGNNSRLNYVYSVPDLDKSLVSRLSLEANLDVSMPLETESMDGWYFEKNNVTYFVYAPKKYRDKVIDTDYNQSLDVMLSTELEVALKQARIDPACNLDFQSFLSLLVTYAFSLAFIHRMEFTRVESIKTYNTATTYESNFRLLREGARIPSTSHVGAFSWIYYLEIMALQSYFSGAESVSVHDVATNTCHLPILLSKLNRYTFIDPKFSVSCSDLETGPASQNIKTVSKLSEAMMDEIVLSKLDLTADLGSLAAHDVIIANDVLEHFPEDISYAVFRKLWEVTKDLLVVHVPFEEKPNPMYGHLTAFNVEKLRTWAYSLSDCENITSMLDSLISGSFDPHIADGFLILKKLS